jgi:very-long-chain ceramide synthase
VGIPSSHSSSPTPTIDQPSEQEKFSKRKKAASLQCTRKHFFIRHTWTIPLILLLASLSLYAINPTESNIVHHFIFLSYKQPSLDHRAPSHYGKGLWDIAFVSFYTIVLSFTREFIMQELLRPLACICRIKSRGKQTRFMEQMYTAIYFGLMGPAGVYVMRRTPVWYFNTRGMYEFFPHKTHEAAFKFYY